MALNADRGNFVSEWFGHRVYPSVAKAASSLKDQRDSRCPFLSRVLSTNTTCIKKVSAHGTCTISSTSNGPRQDWLVCPYRALDAGLLESIARRVFVSDPNRGALILPAPTLKNKGIRERLSASVQAGDLVVVYLQDKLGGEISIAATDRSPELSFDITMVRVVGLGSEISLGKYGLLEVQTMDFHGSYAHAVSNLKAALHLHQGKFHRALEENRRWLSDRIEGPNIANVFKRTFYQMMLKFQIGADESCAGSVLAIPVSVWDSWQRHLAKPELQVRDDGTHVLRHPDDRDAAVRTPAWIYLFDIDSDSSTTPSPISVQRVIATDAEAVSYYALKAAPQAAVVGVGGADRLLATIRRRIGAWWPELSKGAIDLRKQ